MYTESKRAWRTQHGLFTDNLCIPEKIHMWLIYKEIHVFMRPKRMSYISNQNQPDSTYAIQKHDSNDITIVLF